MPDIRLHAETPLAGLDKTIADTRVREVTGKAMVSIAPPLKGEKALAAALKKAYGLTIPAVGHSTLGRRSHRLLAMQRDQFFLLFDHAGDGAVTAVAKTLGNVAYLSDQSDSWVMLEMSGPKARAALERMSMVDMSPQAFVEGQVARTAIEHMGAIIVRLPGETFMLMAMRSYAGSFLHAVETSLTNVA